MTQKKANVKNSMLTGSQVKMLIERDIYRKLLSNPVNKNNIKQFILDYLADSNDPETTPSLILAYKNHKKIPVDKDVFNVKTLQNKITQFLAKDDKHKNKILQYKVENAKYGGFRKDNVKVSDDTIKCMVTLAVDFPNLSTNAITAYINSPFGTNFESPLNPRTVQRYLKNLDFSVKKVQFAPPNRNSIGLRILRVAWTKIIQKIIKKDNVLIGFIDEASVTTNEGPTQGRSYIGITPVVNCPLSKTKVSVLSLVLPGFGVLYQFINGPVDNEQYSTFLKDVVRFIRRFICNDETEIVFIEDNCPIHCTQLVEDTIKRLKIAVLPTVPYSPSLNGVVEGLFGYVKTNFVRVIEQTSEAKIQEEIMINWREFINTNFNLDFAHSLYYEWRIRLKQCEDGKAIYSGHIEPDKSVKVDFDRLQCVTTDRLISK